MEMLKALWEGIGSHPGQGLVPEMAAQEGQENEGEPGLENALHLGGSGANADKVHSPVPMIRCEPTARKVVFHTLECHRWGRYQACHLC